MPQNDEKHNQCSQNLKMMFTSHMNTTNLCVIHMMWIEHIRASSWEKMKMADII